MKFGNPNYFHLLWLVIILTSFYVYSFKKNRRLLKRWGESRLVNKLTSEVSFAKKGLKAVLFLAGILFIIMALAQPKWGYKWEEIKRKGIDIVILLDTSKSMLSDDVKPNRLTAAKRNIEDLINTLEGDRIGLVAFSGTSFLSCPLTLDYNGFRLFLDTIDTEIIPQGGTDIGGAIRNALNAFGSAAEKHKAIILITDGEDHAGNIDGAARAAREKLVPVYVVGIGGKEGVPIPMPNEEGNKTYLKDIKGNIVLSKLDDTALKKIALITDGVYMSAETGQASLDKIYKDRIKKMEKKELESAQRKIYENRYQIPLGIAFVLLVVCGMIGERIPRPPSASTPFAKRGMLKPSNEERGTRNEE